MYTHTVKKLPKRTVELLITIPKADIEKEHGVAFETLQKDLAVEGFRKGNVPRAIAEKHLAKEVIYQELLKSLLSRIYDEIVKKENLQPVISPKIELVAAKEGEDWEVKITLAERPVIELKSYKEAIKKAKSEQKKDDIWVPGKGEEKKTSETESEEKKQKQLNSILTTLLNEATCEISDLIIEEELSHRLTQLVDDVRKIGLTVDNYLKSKNLTMDVLKNRYKKEIEDTYKLEFILMDVANKENIKVEKAEIDKLFTNIANEAERKAAEQNAYFYASILRKQKTLDFLMSL